MWIAYALLAALFAGITAVLAKIGVADVDANLATALRTAVVAVFAWLMVFVVGSQSTLPDVDFKTFFFLVLSGLATGGSWLYYFKALQTGDVNKVVPIDKSSVVLTMFLAFVLLGEEVTLLKAACMVLIGCGAYMMIEKKRPAGTTAKPRGEKWLVYALLSTLFASLTAILGKVGIEGIESNLGTAIRTLVVLAMAWLIVFRCGTQRQIREIGRRSRIFLFLSGLATGLSWLCYYRALQEGPASAVAPIDKLSIFVAVFFGRVVFKETLARKAAVGLAMIVAGTLLLLA